MRHIALATLLLMPVIVSGCASIDDDIARYEHMSCYDIAKEIGREEVKLETAKDDADSATWGQILSDNDAEEDDAVVDEIIADGEAKWAEDRLDELRRVEYKKGCRH